MYKVEIADSHMEVSSKDGITFFNGNSVSLDVVSLEQNVLHLMVNNKPITAEFIEIEKETKTITLMINNQKAIVKLKDTFDLLLHDLGLDALAAKKVQNIKAPMPGMVLKVLVEDGQLIKKGENLLVLEAMKMENMLKASEDCVISKLLIQAGDKVEKGQILIEL